MPRIKSIQQLRRELQVKEKQVGKLQSKRNKLVARLDQIDRQIAALAGKARGGGFKAALREEKAVTRRRATGKPLVEYIQSVLKKAKNGMRVKEITQAVTKAGYRSHSKDFYGIVAATVRDESKFRRIGRGVYKLGG